MELKKISVIGSGTMGNGIAHVMAQNNFEVSLIDIHAEALEKGINTITKNLDRLLAKERITQETVDLTLQNISTFTSLKEGVKDADLVIEAASENEKIKFDIFAQLDNLAPKHTILATNTSSIPITKIASKTTRPQQVIGMHFMNPVPIMKLVEIINGYETSKEVTKAINDLTLKINKTPITVEDFPGFIANRILMPMINEAIYSLQEGVAGVTEIDQIMKLGMGHPMGPLQLADFIGLDICLNILNVLYEGFKQPKYAPCPLLVQMVQANNLGIKSGMGFYDYSDSKKAEIVAPKFK